MRRLTRPPASTRTRSFRKPKTGIVPGPPQTGHGIYFALLIESQMVIGPTLMSFLGELSPTHTTIRPWSIVSHIYLAFGTQLALQMPHTKPWLPSGIVMCLWVW